MVLQSSSLARWILIIYCVLDPGWKTSYHSIKCFMKYVPLSFPFCKFSSDGKESACNAGGLGSIPGLGMSPGERNGNPLQCSCLKNPMGRGAWRATVYAVAKSRTRLSNFTSLHFEKTVRIMKNPSQDMVYSGLLHWWYFHRLSGRRLTQWNP